MHAGRTAATGCMHAWPEEDQVDPSFLTCVAALRLRQVRKAATLPRQQLLSLSARSRIVPCVQRMVRQCLSSPLSPLTRLNAASTLAAQDCHRPPHGVLPSACPALQHSRFSLAAAARGAEKRRDVQRQPRELRHVDEPAPARSDLHLQGARQAARRLTSRLLTSALAHRAGRRPLLARGYVLHPGKHDQVPSRPGRGAAFSRNSRLLSFASLSLIAFLVGVGQGAGGELEARGQASGRWRARPGTERRLGRRQRARRGRARKGRGRPGRPGRRARRRARTRRGKTRGAARVGMKTSLNRGLVRCKRGRLVPRCALVPLAVVRREKRRAGPRLLEQGALVLFLLTAHRRSSASY